MNIQGYQKLTLLDFPGKVACTVFTGGCNLRCPFCHNASLVLFPTENMNLHDEVLAYLSKRKGVLDGVCVTGGEPLLQPDLADFLTELKRMGYAVKLDTNGSDPKRLQNILETGTVDYVAMDVKSAPSTYEKAIGVPFEFSVFEKSLSVLRASGVPYELRTTLVKGIHTESDLIEIASYLEGEKRFFLQGFVDSGLLLRDGFEAFSQEEMKRFLAIIRKKIPPAQLRGQKE